MLLLLVIFAAFVSAEAPENANYKCTLSEDGKTATVTVTLDGYEKADSMMIIPDFDENNLSLIEGDWLLRGAIRDGWNEDTGDAVIAFSKPTNVNVDVFEMVFEVKGDVAALDSVKCDIIVKTINREDEETQIPTTEPISPTPDISETDISETEPPNEPVESEKADTEAVAPETDEIKETEPIDTDIVESESLETETIPDETFVVEAESVETDSEQTSPTEETEDTLSSDKHANGGYPHYYGGAADETDEYSQTVILIVGIVVTAGVTLLVLLAVRAKRKKH